MDTTGAAVDLSNLRRIRRELVPPPGAHEHEQVAPAGPRIVGFEMTRRGAQPLELLRRLRGRGAPP